MINVFWTVVVAIVVGCSKMVFHSLCSRVECAYSSAMFMISRHGGYGMKLVSMLFFVVGEEERSVFSLNFYVKIFIFKGENFILKR